MRTQQIIVAIVMLFGAFVAIFEAIKPDRNLLRFEIIGQKAYGFGHTDDRSVGQITEFLSDNPKFETLILKSMSGTIDADMNLRLARRIRKLGLHTHLDGNSYIASGAVDLFLAGVKRTMDCGARIGVHRWSYGKGTDPVKTGFDPRQRRHENFLKDMGIDPEFYVFTREAAPPTSVHILTPDEINRFGLLSTPTTCKG